MRFERTPVSQAVLAAIATLPGAAIAAEQKAIEEIVVTATKRAESIQDIAVAVTAMQGDDIDELGIDNFDEYVQYLPNVVFSGRGPGQAELYIRGAATEQSAITVSSIQGSAPAVALYQDEQPVSFGGRNLDIYSTDLERIEVLAGPQGTLFGASSQTGTVRLITNKPQHDGFDAGIDTKMAFTAGGEPSTAVEAFLNLPLSEKLAVRVAAYSDRAGGWIDNELGTYTGNIEVMNRNQISSAAHICTGDPAVDDPIGGSCGGVRATMASANNSGLVEDDFNEATYTGARIGASFIINEDWDLLVQHTNQRLKTEGVFEYDPVLGQEDAVNRFTPSRNQDEFGLTTWTLEGRISELDVIYTGGYLDRDVFYTQDYTGYTNGGGYQAYYICTGGYSNYSECFDPTKQYVENTTNERQTHELRVNWDPVDRVRVTAGVFFDKQETISDGQFQYPGAVDAGYVVSSAPGTITDPGSTPPTASNIVSTVDGVDNPFGRGPDTIFVNNFKREEEQIAVFGEVSVDLTNQITASFGARYYDLDSEFQGSTGSSFGCKFATIQPCDGQSFDNRVSQRLEALGAFEASGNVADLETFYSAGNAGLIADGVANGSFFIDGLNRDGVINQNDTIFRATLSWDVTDDVMLFTTWSEGFRPQTVNRNAGTPSGNQTGVYQGYLVPAIARTDDLENFEVGMKGSFLEKTLQVNATWYTSDISDLQVSRFDPANVAFLVFIENAGDAEVQGLDVDFTWLATDRLTISGAASWVDNELSRINPQLNEIVVAEGSRLPWTAKFRANLRARYDFPLAGGTDAYARAAVTYTGSSRSGSTCDAYFVEDVTQQVFGAPSGLTIKDEGGFCGTALEGDDLASVVDTSFVGVDGNGDTRFRAGRYEQEEYVLVNVGVGVKRDSWSAELFVNNLFNERAQLNVNATDYTPSVTTNRPRTVGLRFGYDFN
ncbi:MAG: TonB-dependent receptor [Pseudomonadota bacterium]